MRRRFPTLSMLCVVGAALPACDSPTDGLPIPPEIVSVAIDSSAGPLIRSATITLDRPARVEAAWASPGLQTLVLDTEDEAVEHTLVLPRLRASRDYVLTVRLPDHTATPVVTGFGTGALPADLAALTFTETGTPTHPVALVEIVTSTSPFLGLLIVEDGEIVWYQSTTGSLFGTARRDNGNLVLMDGALGLVEYRLNGSIAHRLPQPEDAPGAAYGRIHHEVIATPQNTLLLIANETRTVAGQSVVGEAIWEWTPESGAVQKRWSAFDHLDWTTERGPRSDPSNWLHGNGLAYGPGGDVLVSFRNLDQIVSIAPGFGSVQWRLGGAGATIAQPAADRFHGQHGPSAPAAGRLLLFDNGFNRPEGLFSRVIEYQVDAGSGTATPVWEFRPAPDIYAPVVGSAYRLANANTVALFGMVAGSQQSTGPLIALEITPDGTEQWRLTAGPAVTRLYRVRPLESLLGEEPLSLPAR